MTDPTYIIGIDLGTTNSVVAYTAARFEKGRPADIRTLDVLQLVQAGTVESRPLLPSFIFSPGPHDIPRAAWNFPGMRMPAWRWGNSPVSAAPKCPTG